jgi:cell wall-associated NlpC family hydrolase
MSLAHRLLGLLATALLAGCASAPPADLSHGTSGRRADVVMLALGLVDTGYRFGGRNPQAGLDCSGMVAYVFDHAMGLRLSGSAADIARQGHGVDRHRLQPADLVFFNTLDRPHSHVGIYIGDGRFVHAPSTDGRVRIDSLDRGWFASRFEEGRSYLD